MAKSFLSQGALKTSFRFFPDFDKLARKVQAKEKRVLFLTGSWTKNRMQWKLSKRPPQRETAKRKGISARWKREIIGGAERPPYNRTGALKNLVRFEVNEKRGSVVIGPAKLRVPSDVRPQSKTVPQMLDEGGTAIVGEQEQVWRTGLAGKKYITWRPTGRQIIARYRAFPFVKKTADEAFEKLMQRLEKERL